MDKEKAIQMFKEIGLSENESLVYFAMLSLGASTPLKISRISGVKRTTVYPVIESLKIKGLVYIEQKGFKKSFVAEGPERLESLIDEKNSALKKGLPVVKELFKTDNFSESIKYYHGKNAICSLYDGILKELKINDFYFAIFNTQRWDNIDADFLMKHVEKRSKIKIETKLLIQESEKAHWRKKYEKNFNEEIKILPKDTTINIDLVITPKKVIMFPLVDPLMAFVIENKFIVETEKEMFKVIWNSIKN